MATLALLAAALWVPGRRYAPPYIHQAKYLHRQRQAMNYTPPPGLIVYEDDPIEARKLVAAGNGYVSAHTSTLKPADPAWRAVGYLPPELRAIGKNWVCNVFLHGLTTPAGERRLGLVFVAATGTGSTRDVRLYGLGRLPATWAPGSQPATPPGYKSRPLHLHLGSGDRLQLFAGRPDPHNPSVLNIGYKLNGTPGEVEGKLADDGAIRLKVRSGPLLQKSTALP